MAVQQSLKIVAHGEIAVVEFDMIGEKANVFNTATMTKLKEIVDELKISKYKMVLWVSKKPKIFIAGADINEIRNLTSLEQFSAAVAGGQTVFNMLEDLPMPTMAVIHGACVGGGCEFALACDYRIASDDQATRIGLPEIKLGIIPGFGGCVRLPRVVGLENSLDIILAGKTVAGKKALKMGLVDQMVHVDLLFDFAMKWGKELIQKGGQKRLKTYRPQSIGSKVANSVIGAPMVFMMAKKATLKMTHGHYPAPLMALSVIANSWRLSSREKALEIERNGFCEVAITAVSKNLIHVFDLLEMVKKQNGTQNISVEAKEVRSMGVLGAGVMGGGIAYIAADKGIEVRLKDLNFSAIGKGIQHAAELWGMLIKSRVLNDYEVKQRLSRISGGTDFAGFKTFDLVIEAIVEDLEIKKKVIVETAQLMRADAIMATNTSSLSVNEMAKVHPHPEYFVGMHFFNPVHKMPLVEVIRGAKTSDTTVATIFELAKKMGKIPVVTQDGPGFLVNRLLLPYMAEAMFLLQDGMGFEQVDRIFVKEFGMPMGPYALMDEVGLDVCAKVFKIFRKVFGERIEIPTAMEALEKSKRLGKKGQKGFYFYDSKGKLLKPDPSIYAEMGLSGPTNQLTSQECIERAIFSMINECALTLIDDKVVKNAREVDLAMIMGTGFAPFRGGLLRYADTIGVPQICHQLESYAAKNRPRLKPSAPLIALAKANKGFYSISN